MLKQLDMSRFQTPGLVTLIVVIFGVLLVMLSPAWIRNDLIVVINIPKPWRSIMAAIVHVSSFAILSSALLHFCFRYFHSSFHVLFLGFMAAGVIEALQLFAEGRRPTVIDFVYNCSGVLIGFWFYKLKFRHVFNRIWRAANMPTYCE